MVDIVTHAVIGLVLGAPFIASAPEVTCEITMRNGITTQIDFYV